LTQVASSRAGRFARTDRGALLGRLRRWKQPLLFGATIAGALVWLAYVAVLGEGEATDVRGYFLAIYRPPGAPDSFVYSPAFEQLTEPLRWLGWDAFRTAWRLFEVAALIAMAGPFAAPLLFVAPVAGEVNNADINLLMPAAIIGSFRYPALWAFPILTKITPAVGLVWYAMRHEWRSLAIALGTTAAIVVVSFATVPLLWADWIRLLLTSDPDYADVVVIAAPIWVRVVAGATIVAWGAATDRRWTVIVGVWVSLPATWLTTLAMLTGVLWYWRTARIGQSIRTGE
jgi:hypothetical protein